MLGISNLGSAHMKNDDPADPAALQRSDLEIDLAMLLGQPTKEPSIRDLMEQMGAMESGLVRSVVTSYPACNSNA